MDENFEANVPTVHQVYIENAGRLRFLPQLRLRIGFVTTLGVPILVVA